jgi:superfamily II DNA or RNA helicase
MTAAFSAWRFSGQWRRYQTLCLEAFEADCAAGRDQTLVVAPPGSGKTVVGLEVVRRLAVPALVLCPTLTIQRQWAEKQALFGPGSADLHVLTYQSLCQTTDPEGMLRDAAERIWIQERATATGQTVDEVVAETAAWDGQAARERERDVGRIVARGKRDVAAGRLPDIPAHLLLSANAVARVQGLRDAGVRVVVLDECHHLLSLWGALLKAVFELLSPEHVLGLTATNPKDVTAEQADLYAALLDTVDFSVPTPAVVREGYLAPYQELVQLCSPLDSEQQWLAERHARFELALAGMADADGELLGLDAWLLSRLSERLAAGGGRLSWAELARRRPRLADAGLRWLHARGIPAPDDAPRGEQQRAEPTVDDWVVLLEDYALRCLRADASAEAARRLDELQVALGDLGFALTRQGIRRVGGEVDRVLLNSAAKPLAMCDALACEYDTRGRALRAVVLCDSEHPPRQAADSPLALTGGARGLLASLGADERFVGSRAALVTGETFAVLPGDADWWAERLDGLAGWPGFAAGLRREPDGGLVVLRHDDGRFSSQAWTEWVTRLLADGEILVLFGTRGLLGEGWDCPPVNVLVDMTAVAADVAVRQMRGRSLRLDPDDPGKLANNWDIVCVAPALGRGHADYSRFVRRHAHLHAPCEDGTIETGPSHVHPELSPYGPPAAGRFVAINLEQQDRAGDREATRERWRIGEPYRGVDLDVLVVRNPRRAAEQPQVALADVRPLRSRWQTASAAAGLAAAAGLTATGGALAAPALLAVGVVALVVAGAAVAWARRLARRAHPAELPLEWAAAAVCDAYVALEELTPEVAGTMSFTVRPEGWVRASLPDGDAVVSRHVSAALDELYGGGALARYVVSRKVVTGRRPFGGARAAWHSVPADLARRKDRAEAFHAAWQGWMGAGELVYCHGAGGRGTDLAAQASRVPALETQRRRIWR